MNWSLVPSLSDVFSAVADRHCAKALPVEISNLALPAAVPEPQEYVTEWPSGLFSEGLGNCFTYFWGPGRSLVELLLHPAVQWWTSAGFAMNLLKDNLRAPAVC